LGDEDLGPNKRAQRARVSPQPERLLKARPLRPRAMSVSERAPIPPPLSLRHLKGQMKSEKLKIVFGFFSAQCYEIVHKPCRGGFTIAPGIARGVKDINIGCPEGALQSTGWIKYALYEGLKCPFRTH